MKLIIATSEDEAHEKVYSSDPESKIEEEIKRIETIEIETDRW